MQAVCGARRGTGMGLHLCEDPGWLRQTKQPFLVFPPAALCCSGLCAALLFSSPGYPTPKAAGWAGLCHRCWALPASFPCDSLDSALSWQKAVAELLLCPPARSWWDCSCHRRGPARVPRWPHRWTQTQQRSLVELSKPCAIRNRTETSLDFL